MLFFYYEFNQLPSCPCHLSSRTNPKRIPCQLLCQWYLNVSNHAHSWRYIKMVCFFFFIQLQVPNQSGPTKWNKFQTSRYIYLAEPYIFLAERQTPHNIVSDSFLLTLLSLFDTLHTYYILQEQAYYRQRHAH